MDLRDNFHARKIQILEPSSIGVLIQITPCQRKVDRKVEMGSNGACYWHSDDRKIALHPALCRRAGCSVPRLSLWFFCIGGDSEMAVGIFDPIYYGERCLSVLSGSCGGRDLRNRFDEIPTRVDRQASASCDKILLHLRINGKSQEMKAQNDDVSKARGKCRRVKVRGKERMQQRLLHLRKPVSRKSPARATNNAGV
ncbi:hypothetical protein FIBSPDRAFT_896360 [Athelia psychrophila]|uniref:Uncharacterized protein n=1 Tax=Athelia psychrophila TaxID=1759441 RepID=A0A166DHZ5_9AGAM|nr:hypothetical protein FIBSPDRAFT_896360 [Fibularhizoctonia sp. CBS 109695]